GARERRPRGSPRPVRARPRAARRPAPRSPPGRLGPDRGARRVRPLLRLRHVPALGAPRPPPFVPDRGAAPQEGLGLGSSAGMSEARRVGLRLLVTALFLVAFACAERTFLARGGPEVRDLELSFTPGAFQQILLAWGAAHPEGVGAFKRTLVLLDFAFPVAYAARLAGLCRWVVTTGGGEPLRAGRIAPWIAAAFDWLENLLLLALLWGVHDKDGIRTAQFSSGLVGLMSVAAALKFASLLVVLSLTFVALFLGARGRVLWRTRFGVLSLLLGSVPLLVVPQAQDLLVTLADPVAAGLLPRVSFFVFLCVWAASVWYWS